MKITYTNDCTVEETDSSLSLLQISLKHEIPHTHVCGGNARCSTCRILVLKGAENLEPRNEAETALALRKGFTDDIRVA
ncbi:MAG TPA: 2Fe-2S iron-sulfur cluster-binding protein, partial [Leptospiraceae bacterium]|nr:2Fe-2S iron-sulfur cluster-binding protein [Leptospiraceae bacterium]